MAGPGSGGIQPGDERVPAADSTGNTLSKEVVGNKSDVAAVGLSTNTDSAMAYLKQLILKAVDGSLIYTGTVDSIPGANQFIVSEFAGLGAGKFVGLWPFWVYVVRDAGGAGAAPQGELQAITAYTSATGAFTHNAFTAALVASDQVAILHPMIANMVTVLGYHTVPTANSTANVLVRDVLGNKADTTAAGAVTATDTVMAYIKQLVTDLILVLADTGTDGVVLGTKVAAFKTLAGETQVAKTTIDLQQAAASYDLFTGTTDDFIVERLVIRFPAVDVSDDAALTSISIQTDDATPGVFISSATGAVANLTSEAQLGWTGVMYIDTGSKIQLTIAGGAADAATVCEVVAIGRAVGDGGNLA